MRRMGHPAAEPRRDTPIPASAQVPSRTRRWEARVRLETCALTGIGVPRRGAAPVGGCGDEALDDGGGGRLVGDRGCGSVVVELPRLQIAQNAPDQAPGAPCVSSGSRSSPRGPAEREMAPWEDRSAPHPIIPPPEPRNHAETVGATRGAGANDPPRAPESDPGAARRLPRFPVTASTGPARSSPPLPMRARAAAASHRRSTRGASTAPTAPAQTPTSRKSPDPQTSRPKSPDPQKGPP